MTTSFEYPPSLQARVNGLATAALVSGLLFFTGVGAVLAVVFGHLALGQIKASRGLQRGDGMALAGLVLGYSGIAIVAIAVLVGPAGLG